MIPYYRGNYITGNCTNPTLSLYSTVSIVRVSYSIVTMYKIFPYPVSIVRVSYIGSVLYRIYS